MSTSTSRAFEALLRERTAELFPLSDDQIASLARHYELLVRWNRVLNLTRVVEPEEAVTRHYVESLFLARYLPNEARQVADVGSGAGFPGFPLAIARPEVQVTLIESHHRKAVFLREATREIANIRVTAGRAEDVKGCFDWAVSRAVDPKAIAGTVVKLAGHFALLTGGGGPHDVCGIHWDEPIALPAARNRFLWIGSVSRETVPRETSC